MAMKRYSTFPKAPGLEPHHHMHFSFISRTLNRREFYLSAELHSAYSTILNDWVVNNDYKTKRWQCDYR